MRRQLSIRTRLTLWHMGLLLISLIGFSVVLYAAFSEQVYRALDDRLRLGAAAARFERFDFEDDENPSNLLAQNDFSARLIDRTGRVMGASGVLSAAPLDQNVLTLAEQGRSTEYTFALTDGSLVRAYMLPLTRDGRLAGFVEVAEPLEATNASLRSLALILILAVPFTVVAAALGAWFITDRALRPIDAITRQAQRMSEQDLHHRLNLKLPDDEVGRLARTFDAMLGRLDAAFRRQRQFTADASHELRTPLTVMKTNIGVTLNRPRTAVEYSTALAQVEGEVDRLTRLTNDLLLLARADAGQTLGTLRPVALSTLARDVAAELQPLARSRGLALTCTIDTATVRGDSATVRGDADQLRRLLYNLIENAIKYTTTGGVTVRVSVQAGRGRIAIEDTGPGIPPEDVPHVFERFYRVDAARSREQGGSGLGLSIARSIVVAHGGSIDVSSEVGRGTTFTVNLPVP